MYEMSDENHLSTQLQRWKETSPRLRDSLSWLHAYDPTFFPSPYSGPPWIYLRTSRTSVRRPLVDVLAEDETIEPPQPQTTTTTS